MKCPKCGWDNQAQARYCSHCGTALPRKKREKVFCVECGAPNETSARFCRECGTELVRPTRAAKNRINTASKNRSGPASARSAKKNSFALNLGVGVAIALLLLGVYGLQNRSNHRPSTPSSPPAAVAQNPIIEAQVIEVASRFRCSCGTCGGTPLDECSCETAIEEKNFIRQKLLEGHKIPHIVTLVNETYGWIKPEFEKQEPTL